jgi:transposase
VHYLIKSIRTTLCSSKLKPTCHYDHTYQYRRRQIAVCCSLLSSSSKMGRSWELSDFERGLVIGCQISKKSVRDIATLLKLPKSMVGDMIVKWKREGTTTRKPRPVRPHLMTDRDRRVLKKVVHETCQTLSETITWEFCSDMNFPASTMTVCRELRGMGFHGRAAAYKPNISPVNAKRLLKWCKERRHWAVDKWKHVISSDESHYTMWRSDGRVRVRQMPGE